MPYSRNEYKLMAFAGFGHFVTHLLELMYPTAALAISADSGLSLAAVLGLSFLGYLLFGLGALPAGLLTDSVGAKHMLVITLSVAAFGTIATGMVDPGPALMLTLAVTGLALSAYHPAGMSLLSRGVRARGRALGINGMCGNLGVTLAPVITVALQSRLGWRGAYITVGLVTLVVILLFSLINVEEPSRPSKTREGGQQSQQRASSRHLFFLLCLTATLAGVVYRSNTVALPAYFNERVTLIGYGTATSLVYLLGIPGQYLGGVLADRHDLRWLYLLAHAFTLPLLLVLAYTSGVPLVVVAAMTILFSLGMQPVENSLFAKLTPARWRATGYGIKFVLTFGIGSLGVQLAERAELKGDLSLTFIWLAGLAAVMVATATGLIIFSTKPLMNPRRQSAVDSGSGL